MDELENANKQKKFLILLNQFAESQIQIYDVELQRFRNELTGLENNLNIYISNNPGIQHKMNEEWQKDPTLLISSFDNNTKTIHMISRNNYLEKIKQLDEELKSSRNARRLNDETLSNFELKIISFTTSINEHCSKMEEKSTEINALNSKIEKDVEHLNLEITLNTTEFDKNQNIIQQILGVTGYENATELIDDSKRMKLEIREKINIDLKFDYNSSFYKRLQNELNSEHWIIMKFIENTKNISFFNSNQLKKNSLEPLIEEFESLEKEHLCKFLRNDVSDLLVLEELLEDDETQKEIKADEEDLKVMKGHIYQFKTCKMNELIKPFLRNVINILNMI